MRRCVPIRSRVARRTLPRLAPAALVATTLLVGCAVTPSFPEHQAGPFRPKVELGPQSGHRPDAPHPPPGSQSPRGQPPGPAQGCDDPDPQVITTCLEPISDIVVLDGRALIGMVAERTTGRIVRVQRDRPVREVTTLPVDVTADGGLTGLALSPSYDEDELIYAYITTPTDNRVVRIAPRDAPKPILTGIPRGSTGNAGALALRRDGTLLVATGNAGDPAAAQDPDSLAGKVLRLDISGDSPADSASSASPTGETAVMAAELHAPGGMCIDPLTDEVWITDRSPANDLLYRLPPDDSGRADTSLGPPAWTWNSDRGAAGCAVLQGRIQVAFTSGAPMFAVGIGPNGTFLGQPREIALDHYGQVSAAALSPEGRMIWLGTVNKDGGDPVSSDERVFVLTDPLGPGGGHD